MPAKLRFIVRFTKQIICVNNKIFFFCLFIHISFSLYTASAQDLTGIISDRYNGINRHILNPSSLWLAHNCLHISLITANAGFENSLFNLDLATGNLVAKEGIEYLNGVQYGRLHGPSVMYKYGNHIFGFSNSIRTISGANNVPSHLARFYTEGIRVPQLQNQFYEEYQPFAIRSMSWAEISFIYATVLRQTLRHNISGGITLRPLLGIHGIRAGSDQVTYIVNNNRDLTVYNINFDTYGALPVDYGTMEFMGAGNSVLGGGFSFDLGFTWISKREDDLYRRAEDLRYKNGEEELYAWTWGVSLLDVGAYTLKRNTRRATLTNARFFIPGFDFDNFSGPRLFVDEIESRLLTGNIVREEDENYRFFLPSAVSSQFDFYHGNGIYSYLLWVHDIPLVENRVSRPSVIGYIPRYESRFFTAAMPLTFYDYKKPRIGISFRFGFLNIGTDALGRLMGIGDRDGADLYFSLHWGFKCKSAVKACPEK
jgi:hypothetical protein